MAAMASTRYECIVAMLSVFCSVILSFRIDLFVQNIFDIDLLNFLCFFTYFLDCSATLRLFLRRSLHRCLLADHERSSIPRSFLCNREKLLSCERRGTRCVNIYASGYRKENQPRCDTVQSRYFLLIHNHLHL